MPKDLIFICLEKSRKGEVFGIDFLIFIFISILEVFPRVFLCDFNFQTLCFLTLEPSYLSYLLGSFFVRKIGLWLFIPPSVVTFFYLSSLLCRGECGGCVGIPLVRVDCGGCIWLLVSL